ncbi:MAG: FHA domain-containing protein [Planctomycetaceae bacterium]|nr:FHA domain-containing protein [Planctomycetaceae bacterium]
MWTLVIDTGKHRGREVKLRAKEIVIGRAEEAQIRIGSGEVSRQHCTLQPFKEGVHVTDHGSRNGTLINDVRIESESLLTAGNTLTVGPMRFRLVEIPDIEKSVAPRPGGDQKLTDDDIADWLTDSGHPATGDTTIVGGLGPASTEEQDEEQIAEQEPPVPKRWVPPASKMRFDSIAEEAADIIRRHREMLKAEEEAG